MQKYNSRKSQGKIFILKEIKLWRFGVLLRSFCNKFVQKTNVIIDLQATQKPPYDLNV